MEKHTLAMVIDSRAYMCKFVSIVSKDIVKKFRNVMLVKGMDISRLMLMPNKKDKFKKKEMKNNRARIGSINFCHQSSDGGNCSQFL